MVVLQFRTELFIPLQWITEKFQASLPVVLRETHLWQLPTDLDNRSVLHGGFRTTPSLLSLSHISRMILPFLQISLKPIQSTEAKNCVLLYFYCLKQFVHKYKLRYTLIIFISPLLSPSRPSPLLPILIHPILSSFSRNKKKNK